MQTLHMYATELLPPLVNQSTGTFENQYNQLPGSIAIEVDSSGLGGAQLQGQLSCQGVSVAI